MRCSIFRTSPAKIYGTNVSEKPGGAFPTGRSSPPQATHSAGVCWRSFTTYIKHSASLREPFSPSAPCMKEGFTSGDTPAALEQGTLDLPVDLEPELCVGDAGQADAPWRRLFADRNSCWTEKAWTSSIMAFVGSCKRQQTSHKVLHVADHRQDAVELFIARSFYGGDVCGTGFV